MSSAANIIFPMLFVLIVFIPFFLKIRRGPAAERAAKNTKQEQADAALIRMQEQANQDWYERQNDKSK